MGFCVNQAFEQAKLAGPLGQRKDQQADQPSKDGRQSNAARQSGLAALRPGRPFVAAFRWRRKRKKKKRKNQRKEKERKRGLLWYIKKSSFPP